MRKGSNKRQGLTLSGGEFLKLLGESRIRETLVLDHGDYGAQQVSSASRVQQTHFLTSLIVH